ncbi:MAG: transcription antitermination factor NusB [Armatimonadetes bacterium]|nr:transcription antitermination factor NusB [Armatimonadota bacterium]
MDMTGKELEDAVELIRKEAANPSTVNFVPEQTRESVLRFFEEVVRGFWEERSEIDRLLQERTRNWSWDRLARVDRNIMRMGAYELLHRPDIPAGVAINEAVELAKRYGDEKSGAFVNGILDSVYKTAGKGVAPE